MKTGRGIYLIANARPIERTPDAVTLTLSLDRADGIEKVALRIRIATSLPTPADSASPENLIDRLTPWLEREFEQTREAALKSIRTEHKLLEITFNEKTPGPFV